MRIRNTQTLVLVLAFSLGTVLAQCGSMSLTQPQSISTPKPLPLPKIPVSAHVTIPGNWHPSKSSCTTVLTPYSYIQPESHLSIYDRQGEILGELQVASQGRVDAEGCVFKLVGELPYRDAYFVRLERLNGKRRVWGVEYGERVSGVMYRSW